MFDVGPSTRHMLINLISFLERSGVISQESFARMIDIPSCVP